MPVTGLGAVTPLGGDVATTWAGLLEGRSGIGLIEEDWAEGLSVRIAGRLPVDPAEVLGRVTARRLDRCQQAALVAAREAWADAGAPDVEPERLAVVIGTGVGGVLTTLTQNVILETSGPRRVSPYTVPMLMPNGPAAVVSIELGARGGAHTPVSARATGAEAIAMGLDLIRLGRADGPGELLRLRRPQRVPGVHPRLSGRARAQRRAEAPHKSAAQKRRTRAPRRSAA